MSTNVTNTTSSLLKTSDPTKTDRGTTIAQPGADMDKNAFLKILTAELSNQDPDNTKDSTEYVAQMAQFSSLEQMSNLNSNIQLSSANAMIGKMVSLNTLNPNGDPYSGTVRQVTKDGSTIKVGVEVNNNGKTEIDDFSYDSITGVTSDPTESTTVNSTALNALAEASMIGKKAEFDVKDASGNNYTGIVNGIIRNAAGDFDLNITIAGTTEVKQLPASKILSLSEVN
jgi:flagellar basal-body rod modification protein FlgD